jgi:hypothetical protein
VSPAKVGVNFLGLKAEMIAFIPTFFRGLKKVTRVSDVAVYRQLMDSYERFTLSPILKSGPTTVGLHTVNWEGLNSLEQLGQFDRLPMVSSHPLSVHEAAHAIAGNRELEPHLFFFLELVGNNNIREIWNRCLAIKPQTPPTQPLGKLSLKAEAAGKVRVFAMVDPWSQWVLKPIHDTIFDWFLRPIEQDGTFNQMAPIKALLARNPSSLYSLDLSAATDRLPLWLQEAIMAFWTSKEFAHHWARFLVDRDYRLTLKSHKLGASVHYNVRYAVGQPMGAYSSWAMLALTHHFIVQFSAYRAFGRYDTWFKDYAVLGDDIVIGNRAVASQYLGIMKTLGVGIGLHKSLISIKGLALEFAKRTFYKGVDVSPISFTELQAALTHPASAVAFIHKYSLTLVAFLKACGYRYRVLGSLQRPLGKLNAKVRLLILAMNIPFSVEEVENFFKLGGTRTGRSFFETKEMLLYLLETEYVKLAKALNTALYNAHSLELAHVRAKYIAQQLFNKQGPSGGYGMNYIIPLVKEIMYSTQIHAKGVVIQMLHQLKADLTALALNRYEKTTAEIFIGLIAIEKSMGEIPLANLGYARTIDISQRGLSDTLHIKLWKVLSKYSQGTQPIPQSRFGIQEDPDELS